MAFYKEYEKNPIGRDFVCGDIHGCFSSLEKELIRILFDKKKDRLFCTGDLIDRGPESHRALRYTKEDWFFPIMGNHEYMILTSHRSKWARHDVMYHSFNGGSWFYGQSKEYKEEYVQEIKELPLVARVGTTGLVHADIPPFCKSWDTLIKNIKNIETIRFVLWARETVYQEYRKPLDGIDQVYLGHTICEEPKKVGNFNFIDTGFILKEKGREGKLSIMEIKN